jgi:MEDS: MEthanogen/methylotroph, DcmR Sensory domain
MATPGYPGRAMQSPPSAAWRAMIGDDRHPSADELAEVALGVFGRRKAAAISAHLSRCPPCKQLLRQLQGVPRLLAATSYPPMPKRASVRIENALAVEAHRRAAVASGRFPSGHREGSEGVVDSPAVPGPFDHLCWAYHSKAEWADRAAESAAAGIAVGHCVMLVGDASTADIRSELVAMISSTAAGGAADAAPAEARELADFFQFASEGIVDPEASTEARGGALDDALAAGYSGLRVIVDGTPVARTDEQRHATARVEYLRDRKTSSLPVGGMCGYDVEELGPAAVAEVACMHPFINPGAAPFRLYAVDDADFGLAGSIDEATAQGLFRTALSRTDPPAGSELIVDARRAEHICELAMDELDAYAARTGRMAVVRTRSSSSPSHARGR